MDISDFDPDRSWLLPFDKGQAIWYIGSENSIRKGLALLFASLNKHGHILIREPVIFDYLYYGKELIYVVLYESLPKLEYLEYKSKEQEDKNA
jgi:hypothetical protein